MKKVFFDPENCECWSCHKKFPYFGTESPMVSEKVWKIVGYDEPTIKYYDVAGNEWNGGGYICKDCMERRLGRPLQYSDLKDAELGESIPFNEQFVKKYFPDKK